MAVGNPCSQAGEPPYPGQRGEEQKCSRRLTSLQWDWHHSSEETDIAPVRLTSLQWDRHDSSETDITPVRMTSLQWRDWHHSSEETDITPVILTSLQWGDWHHSNVNPPKCLVLSLENSGGTFLFARETLAIIQGCRKLYLIQLNVVFYKDEEQKVSFYRAIVIEWPWNVLMDSSLKKRRE